MNSVITQNIWSQYANLYSKFTPSNQRYLLENISNLAFGKVLDAGVGVGKLIPYLIKNNDVKTIVGIDSNFAMLSNCNDLVSRLNSNIPISILNKNILDVKDLNNFFDTIYLTNVAYSIENPILAFKVLYDVLEPNGQLIFSNPNRDVNMLNIEKKINLAMDMADKDYLRYIEINNLLVGSNLNPPVTYNIDEICDIFSLIGFKVKKDEIKKDYYFNYVSSIIAQKKN